MAVTRDLAIAKVYIAFVGERTSDEIKQGLDALNGASGYLRKLLSSSIALRATPKLNFFYDETGQRSQHLDALIDLAISSNKSSQEES
jgi:ribosome-binding factor A